MSLPRRAEVPENLTWDLKDLYETHGHMLRDLTQAEELVRRLQDFRGRLAAPEQIAGCLSLLEGYLEKKNRAGCYAELSLAVDYTQPEAQALEQQTAERLGRADARVSFIPHELRGCPDELLREVASAHPRFGRFLEDLIRSRPHALGEEGERVLSSLAPVFDLPFRMYRTIKLADLRFDPFEVDGREYPLGYSLFEDRYEYEKDSRVRRAAFEAFSGRLRSVENATAAAYLAQVRQEKILSELRGYDSVIDMLLEEQRVSREAYDAHLDAFFEGIAVPMRRYVRLLARVHHLDQMTFADLKLPLDPDAGPELESGEAEALLLEGLRPLGEEMETVIRRAFSGRWIDVAQNEGKDTGGFCESPYGCHPYILMTWQNRMSDVLTLAHELGHALHFELIHRECPVFDAEPSRYLLEAPSILNEVVMAGSLLQRTQDPRRRRWVLSCLIGDTYYHNCVTHLLEAVWQRKVYRRVDAGEALTGGDLSGMMREVLETFWGGEVRILPGAELTWMRQPHYYMGLYSYTYSAGLSIGTRMARAIQEEGEPARRRWMQALAAGGRVTPGEFARLAGVEIRDGCAARETVKTVASLVEQVEEMTCRLDN